MPELLQRCLDSIPQRDDLEVIVVDDNSNPDIVDFENFPGTNRKNVRTILDKKGGGGGYARNLGLSLATGKWVLFADSDDYFTYCFNDMLEKYKYSDADIIYFNVVGSHSDYYTYVRQGQHLNKYINMAENNRSLSEKKLRYLFGEPWCKLVKKKVIDDNNIRFDCTPVHNDTTFSYLVGYYAKTVDIDPHAIYVYTLRSRSVSRNLTPEKRLVRVDVFARGDKFLKDHNIGDNIIQLHYKEVYRMLCEGKWTLAMKGVGIIKKYNPSRISIWIHIVKRMPLHVYEYIRRSVRIILSNMKFI